ncbi:hypothetical protein [Methylobacterium aquaticum]|uniref:hypothetical protein n=1 Tax=Methylobacterium aquaticum TaxID=270351 RepID=UPI001932CD8B|nr:hypothetical protein [Methylobacterium aquaticum]QRE76501.1 hypothetical protein F1D61_25630 [Methylobacterium aquaticum]
MPALDLSDLLAAASRNGSRREDRDEPTKTPPDVLCLTLQEVAARYVSPCPFKVGDIVTPRNGYYYNNVGVPHVVLEVRNSPIQNFDIVEDMRDQAMPTFGARFDVRVATELLGKIIAFWQESWALEAYTGPRATLD